MLHSKSPVIERAVIAVFDLMTGHSRGDIVSWRAIEAEAGFTRDSGHYTAFRKHLDRRMRTERSIVLRAAPGHGLKLLTLEEHLSRPVRERHRRASRQYRKAVAEIACLPGDALTQTQRVKRTALIQAAEAAATQAHRSVCQVGRVVKQPGHVMPRPPRAAVA